MPLFSVPKSTRGQVALAALHVGMLAIALVVAWQKNGPPPEKAFWAIMSYFVEIAVAGFVEIVVGLFRRYGREA
jgi:hypothetical protein